MAEIISAIKKAHPDCAITPSTKSVCASYQAMYDAGADRYLLRHETANPEHYARLHPAKLSLANRLECLQMLKNWLSGWHRLHGWLALSNNR